MKIIKIKPGEVFVFYSFEKDYIFTLDIRQSPFDKNLYLIEFENNKGLRFANGKYSPNFFLEKNSTVYLGKL